MSTNATASTSRPYVCGVCQRGFARFEHLQRHTRTHTREKPFTCFCGRSFTRNDLLKRHKQRVHHVEQPPASSLDLLSGHERVLLGKVTETLPRSLDSVTADEEPGYLAPDGDQIQGFDGVAQSDIQEFAAFMQTTGLPIDWDGLESFDDAFFTHDAAQIAVQSIPIEDERMQSEEESMTVNAATAIAPVSPLHPRQSNVEAIPVQAQFRISGCERFILRQRFEELGLQTQFVLPSRHALSRYLQSYADQFHKHYPMIHMPTFRPEALPTLTLAMAAVGAQYRGEPKNGLALYQAARMASLAQRQKDSLETITEISIEACVPRIQTLILLMAYGAWDWNIEILSGALDLQSIVAGYVCGCLHGHVSPTGDESSWERWIKEETKRRTVLLAYAYLNIQSITYDLPPAIMNHEVHTVVLPANSLIWEAKSHDEWEAAHSHAPKTSQTSFADALDYLLGNGHSREALLISPLSSFIMLQALIQRINQCRYLQVRPGSALPSGEIVALSEALSRWKATWQRIPDLNLDPRSPDGPIPFTSAAFLALAYAQIHIDICNYRELHTRDPEHIAKCLQSTARPQRNPEVMQALLHAAHTLSVPAQIGITYASSSQVFFWSCQHALCALDSGVFLWKFLASVGETAAAMELSSDERMIISWIRFSLSEALQSIEASELKLADNIDVEDLPVSQLAVLVLRLWARVFSRNRTWALTYEIGASLDLLAEAVASQ